MLMHILVGMCICPQGCRSIMILKQVMCSSTVLEAGIWNQGVSGATGTLPAAGGSWQSLGLHVLLLHSTSLSCDHMAACPLYVCLHIAFNSVCVCLPVSSHLLPIVHVCLHTSSPLLIRASVMFDEDPPNSSMTHLHLHLNYICKDQISK